MHCNILNEYVTGGFFTDTVSPVLTMCDGFTLTPFMVTLPFLQALAASERVLNILDAHSHLSILAVSAIIGAFCYIDSL